MIKISFIITVYKNDKLEFFKEAIESIVNQDYGFNNINIYLGIDVQLPDNTQNYINENSNLFYEIIQRKAIDIINQLDEKAGKDPVSIAAAALCYVAQLKNTKHTLRQIAIAAELSEVTVRNRIKDIRKQVVKK